MMIRIPESWGEASGWICAAFLVGVGTHSFFPQTPVSPEVLVGALCIPIVILCTAPRDASPTIRTIAMLLIACTFGVWRFDQIVPRRTPYVQSWETARWTLGRAQTVTIPLVSRLRAGLTSRIHAAISADEASLVSGMLYGDQVFSPQIKDTFRRAGLMHLVAVSGSNMTIVVNMLSAFFVSLGFRRRQAFVGLTCGIAGFAIFTGLSASVLRAAIMGWLVLFARELGRAPRTRRLLLIAATIQTAITPKLLVFDAGFALSFLATIGILEWTPIMLTRIGAVSERFGLRESLATTLGAMIMTIPYLAWAFGQLSLVGIITNLLALPLVPWIMMFGALAAVWGNLLGAQIIAAPAFGVARLILWIAHIADAFPWLSYRVVQMEFSHMAAAYVLLWQAHRVLLRTEEVSPVDIGSARTVSDVEQA